MKSFSYLSTAAALAWQFFMATACNNNDGKNIETRPVEKETVKKNTFKPPSTFTDTLKIDFPAAVFYHPDSVQLLKIKEQTDSSAFDGSMHEFFYQMRNARRVIKGTWPQLKITEAKNYRYLLFMASGNSRYCIDLDAVYDAYGLLVFNLRKPPRTIDMTNIETEISFYLK